VQALRTKPACLSIHVISAVLDATGGLALMAAIAERFGADSTPQVVHRFLKMATLDWRVDFLRPGLGGHFVATADVTRLLGRLGGRPQCGGRTTAASWWQLALLLT